MNLNYERQGVEKKFFELCSQVVKDCGYALYDMEYFPGNSLLRVYIMDEQTSSAIIEDCVNVDHALTPFIESEEWMPQKLTLEVSSPGIYRALKTKEHLDWACGESIKLTLMSGIDINEEDFPGVPKALTGCRKFVAKLVDSTSSGISLEFEGFKFELEYSDIKKANLGPDTFALLKESEEKENNQ